VNAEAASHSLVPIFFMWVQWC